MKTHFTADYLMNPPHPVSICLIGIGGTGSQVLSILGRLNIALRSLGHPGIDVHAYDPDKISTANVGRQLFSTSEVGSYKATSMISKLNRAYGTSWKAFTTKYNLREGGYNIFITCVDDFKTRLQLGKLFRIKGNQHHDQAKRFYWLDFGNTNDSGQVILGSLFEIKKEDINYPLPCFDEWAAIYSPPKATKNIPSCSLAEALDKQDLMTNSTLANAGMQLLWRLFREGRTDYGGLVMNLNELIINPLLIN